MLEFKRLKEYVDMCKALKKDEFIFSIFDEPMHMLFLHIIVGL